MKWISLLSLMLFVGTANADLRAELTQPNQNFQTESSSHYYNFGQVAVNSMNTVSYTITNTGTTFLQFSTASVWGMNYDANHSCTQGLNPNQRCQFQIRYWPFTVGLHSGQFEARFYGSSTIPESIRVDLWGEAVRR
jgi:hypothetical protein